MTDSATKSVAMTMPEPDSKLKAGKFKDLLRYLGPGIIVASASIGNGEIFFASREGSLFGFSLLWTFLLCAIMKGSVVYAGSKFATLTGEHPATRWGQIIPGSKNWVAIFLGIVAAIAIPSSICGFIKVLGQWTCWTFGIDTAYTVLCGTIWAIVGFLFVFFSYEKMEKVSTGIVLILVIFALLAIFVSNPDWLALLSGFIPTIPAQYPEWVQTKNPEVLSGPILLEIVSAVGILGGGCQDYLGYMGTMSEKNWGMYIDAAKKSPDADVLCGGYDGSVGWFIYPTLIQAKTPNYITMIKELFAPVLTVYVYGEDEYDAMVDHCANSSIYALTGSIFCEDRKEIADLEDRLRHSAGNFNINDKPTGALTGQQPFGGARGSGTNDKAGSIFNMIRWMSPQTIRENLCPPENYRYPYMGEK
ncbi:aldehyde dehydrogenase family protein [Faecalispora jeddahensis]|uniref:aldehyde dehydrogenase family protein n=1 Tax=Faecalispora jeddahensis TaxID=1414721 RepID=UPI0027BA72A1|nr:aldehyde dehydrogenase family protein [Faecalispora jeddahensis]